MDKKSEQKKDHKECGDTDIGVHDYHAGGKRAQLDGLWSIAPKEVVGLGPERLVTDCYKKDTKEDKPSILDMIVTSGPPLLNTSQPKRIL